jgi:hypothetical protein
MTLPRSNVRAFSNVHRRMPCRVEDDVDFRRHARTRELILKLHPELSRVNGIDMHLAKDVLEPEQLRVLRDHFPCPICNRWDRWPVRTTDEAWALSRSPLGCPCSRPGA